MEQKCMQQCESCEQEFDIDTMTRDSEDNFFCKSCWNDLKDAMLEDYESCLNEDV